jgi:ribonucleoside-diphosphate reductase alpha chain
VFDCAFKPANGTRSIHYMGHLKMMGAVQPFISGAISKTINMPTNATVEEIEMAYYEAWKLGLKAVAVYRDGCKRSQPLSTAKDKIADALGVTAVTAVRRKLPDERESITHKFSIGGHEGYITVGKYEDGSAGEIFITMAKEGSTISGLMDSFATMTSLALQHGVPLQLLVDKFTHTRFEPSGFTRNPEIPMAKSIMDYIFKWLASKFLSRELQEQAGVILRDEPSVVTIPTALAMTNVAPLTNKEADFVEKLQTNAPVSLQEPKSGDFGGGRVMGFVASPKNADAPNPAKHGTFLYQQDAPSCSDCGSIMVRNGACYKCLNCGSTSGCS